MKKDSQKMTVYNSYIHSFISFFYDWLHSDEIFNEREQDRIFSNLQKIFTENFNQRNEVKCLDFGCGTGNITNQLLRFRTAKLVAADVSLGVLNMLKEDVRVEKVHLQHGLLKNLGESKFDLIVVYSVLHHIPDYLEVFAQLCDRLSNGGVLYVDHEVCPTYWNELNHLRLIKKQISNISIKKFITIGPYINKVASLFGSRFRFEGDLHVFPDDHIRWDLLEKVAKEKGLAVLDAQNYFLFRESYDFNKFCAVSDSVADMRWTWFKKQSNDS